MNLLLDEFHLMIGETWKCQSITFRWVFWSKKLRDLFLLQRLNRIMTVGQAVRFCEVDLDCAGFTYHGPMFDFDHNYDIYFFK